MEMTEVDGLRAVCFDGVILSGGGVRGIGHLGTLHYYHEKGELDLKKVKVYACTSIGSVISLLMICGYEPTEIFSKAYTLTNIIPIPNLLQIYEGIKNGGIMSIQPLIDIIKEMVLAKLKKIPTLEELYKITGKTLVVSVGNVSKKKGELYSHNSRPNLSVLDAVAMSCNLPILFERIKYNDDYIIDGGFTDNFPSECLELKTCKKILGVAILSKSFFDSSTESPLLYPYNILLMCVMNSLLARLGHIEKNSDKITLIRLNFENASILEFGVTADNKMNMFMKGYEEAKIEDSKELLYIEGWNTLNKQGSTGSGNPTNWDGWDDPF